MMSLFSTKCINLRDNEIALYRCVNNMVRRMREEAKE